MYILNGFIFGLIGGYLIFFMIGSSIPVNNIALLASSGSILAGLLGMLWGALMDSVASKSNELKWFIRAKAIDIEDTILMSIKKEKV